MAPLPLLPRLWARTVIDSETGCYRWTGGKQSGKGDNDYGVINYNGRTRPVHVAAYEEITGVPVPDGYHVDHVRAKGCRYRNCWNIAHLEAVTPRENILRGNSPSARNARAEVCPSGHPYDEENTRVYRGMRHCRACGRERAKAQYRARRAAEGKTVGPPMAEKTHCPQGHPYDAENTKYENGRRACRICRNASSRRSQQRRRDRLKEQKQQTE